MSRTVLITGSTRGLGYATARRFASAGDHVVITGRDPETVARTVAELLGEGLDVSGVDMDVTSEVSVRCAADEVAARVDSLDVVVNNAGVVLEDPARSGAVFAEPSVMARTFQINVVGAATVIEAFLPLVLSSDAGRVVNVSSTMGSITDQADPASPYYATGVPAYRASKSALNSLTVSLAKQLADTNVVVTAVCPGFVQTDLTPINRDNAPLTAEEASEIVWQAGTTAAGSRSGAFVDSGGSVAW